MPCDRGYECKNWSHSGKEKVAQIMTRRGGNTGSHATANFKGAVWKVFNNTHKVKANTDLNRD